jgi:hypothetical protein
MKKFEEGIFSDFEKFEARCGRFIGRKWVFLSCQIDSWERRARRRAIFFTRQLGGRRRDKWVVQARSYMPFCYFFLRRRINLPPLFS